MRIAVGGLALALILGGTYILSGFYSKSPANKAIKKIERLQQDPGREPSSSLISKPSKPSTLPKDSFKPEDNLDPIESVRKELEDLNKCYQSGDCPFSQADSRAYEFEIGQRLKFVLTSFTQWVREHHVEHADVSQLAREYLQSSDGHVKKAALDLIATQPPSPENFNSVLYDALNTNDSNLTGQSLIELQKYQRENEMAQINQVLTEIMSTGSFVVKNRVAELIATHLNQRNVDYFENYSRTLTTDNPVRTYLSAAIVEYRRSRSGG